MIVASLLAAAVITAGPSVRFQDNGAQPASQVIETQAPAPEPVITSTPPVHAESTTEVAPAAAPVRLSNNTERRSSSNFFLVAAELIIGTGVGVLMVPLGVALNIRSGGLSQPPDFTDIFLLGALPALVVAASNYVIGLLDFSQRNLILSALWATLGALIGEAAGFAAGALIGNAVLPDTLTDSSKYALALIIGAFSGPLFAAVGAVIFSELLKPGEEVSVTPSVSGIRRPDGSMAFGPAIVGRF